MTDTTSPDLTPFFERYDRRMRRLLVAALSASSVLSAVIFAHSVDAAGVTGAKPAAIVWVMGIVFPPLVTVACGALWSCMARGRRRTSSPDRRHPASVDDARNGMRIANAGFLFTLALTATGIVEQAMMALFALGYPVPVGDWIPRATTVAVGAATIYLGNLWPRMPTARGLDRKAATRMKANRLSGWMMVIVGVLVVLLGLFLPLLYPLVRALHAHG